MRTPDWRARARYAFDNLMAKGTPALVGLLGLASAALVVVIASLAWILAPDDVRNNGNWAGVLWRALLRTMDPGTMGGDEGSATYLLPGRHLHRQRPDQRVDCRPGGSARSAQQGPISDHRAQPHRAARLVRPGVHRALGLAQANERRTPPLRGHPCRSGPGRDGGDDFGSGLATPAIPGSSAAGAIRSSPPMSIWSAWSLRDRSS